MKDLFIALVFASLAVGIARALVSIAWPAHRLWPPPENEARWQRATAHFAALGWSLGVPAIAILDWDGFVLTHWLRFPLAALLLASGLIAGRAHRRLGTEASVARGELELVTDGPYARTRNPQYLGAVPAYLSVAVAANSGWALLAALLLVAGFVLMPFAEEPWLRERFGDAYRDYAARTPRFLPSGAMPASWAGALATALVLFCLASVAGVL